ncbi:MAG: type II toxin-antitoxin system RelE/ParE family toxin [Dongiaceae bacterium]
MRVFVTKPFARFADRESIGDEDLWEAVARAENRLIDADLGGGAIKQRIARREQGRSGGYRAVVLFRKSSRAFFVYGFAKKDQGNISAKELRAFRILADAMLNMDEAALSAAKRNQTLMEIERDG